MHKHISPESQAILSNGIDAIMRTNPYHELAVKMSAHTTWAGLLEGLERYDQDAGYVRKLKIEYLGLIEDGLVKDPRMSARDARRERQYLMMNGR